MRRILPVILTICSITTATAGEDPDCVTYADLPVPGPACTVEGQGTFAVAAPLGGDHLVYLAGGLLQVYDVSGAGSPSPVATLEVPDYADQQLAVVGAYVYLPALSGAPSSIVDLTDPAQPAIVDSLDHPYRAFSVDGVRVAAQTQSPDGSEIHLLDAADPLEPVLLGTVEAEGRVSLQGDILAVMGVDMATQTSGITLLDIGDLEAPIEILSIAYPMTFGGSGPNAFSMTTSVEHLEFVTDHLILATRYRTTHGSWLYGNFTAHNTYGRKRYDVSDPANPVLEAEHNSHEDDNALPYGNHNLARHGLLMIEGREVFDPLSAELEPIAVLPVRDVVPGGIMHLAADQLAVCDGTDLSRVTFDAWGTQNVGAPLEFGGPAFVPRAACVGDGFTYQFGLYQTDWDFGMSWRLYTEPATAAVANDHVEYWQPRTAKASGRNLLVDDLFHRVETDGGSALQLVPFTIDFGSPARAVAFAPDGDRVASCWGAASEALRITDVVDPAAPDVLVDLPLAGFVTGVTDLVWRGDRLLVIADAGLGVVDVADPAAPDLQGVIDRPDVVWAVFGPGETVLFRAGDQLVAADLTAPDTPVELAARHAGILETPPVVQGDYAYASAAGLITVYEATTLRALGSLFVGTTVVGLDLWEGQPVGAGNGYAYLPPACEAIPTGAADRAPRPVTALHGAFPNPFNPRTTVRFTLDRAQPVRLAVYDLRGHRVRVLAADVFSAGRHELRWDGHDDDGGAAAAGVYLLRLEAGAEVLTAKAVLVK